MSGTFYHSSIFKAPIIVSVHHPTPLAEYLLSLSLSLTPSFLLVFSMPMSDSRIKCLGHILRHPDSLSCFSIFPTKHLLSLRRGAPWAHWPEIALAEAAHRVQIFHQSPPLLEQLLHSFYQHFTIVELKHVASSSMKQWSESNGYFLPSKRYKQPA